MKISKNKFVSVIYDLHVGTDDERELMESATIERPLQFIFGMGAMLPDFEAHLANLEAGNKFTFTLTPEKAYGVRDEDFVVELPKKTFEVEGKFDHEYIVEGVTLPMMNEHGERMNGSVLEVKKDVVIMDFNHPLAGETLHFSGEILDVHDPSEEEVAALNHIFSGGCGSGCDECGDNHECCNSCNC